MEKIIVAGSREFKNYNLLKNTLDKYLNNQEAKIICGGAKGADTLGKLYAESKNLQIQYFFPEWGKWGKIAAHLRNAEMAKVGDTLIAFWDGKSRGTKNMIQLAEKYKLKIIIINY